MRLISRFSILLVLFLIAPKLGWSQDYESQVRDTIQRLDAVRAEGLVVDRNELKLFPKAFKDALTLLASLVNAEALSPTDKTELAGQLTHAYVSTFVDLTSHFKDPISEEPLSTFERSSRWKRTSNAAMAIAANLLRDLALGIKALPFVGADARRNAVIKRIAADLTERLKVLGVAQNESETTALVKVLAGLQQSEIMKFRALNRSVWAAEMTTGLYFGLTGPPIFLTFTSPTMEIIAYSWVFWTGLPLFLAHARNVSTGLSPARLLSRFWKKVKSGPEFSNSCRSSFSRSPKNGDN